MPDEKPLTDNEAHTLLNEAWQLFSGKTGATVRAETALRTGERALLMLQIGLIAAAEAGTDDPKKPPSSPAQPPR